MLESFLWPSKGQLRRGRFLESIDCPVIAALALLRSVVREEAECERAGRVLLEDSCTILAGCIAAEGAVGNVCLLCPAHSTH